TGVEPVVQRGRGVRRLRRAAARRSGGRAATRLHPDNDADDGDHGTKQPGRPAMPSTELTAERPRGNPGGATSAVTPALRCLIVDDQPAALGMLARMLHAHPSVARIRTATDATGALRELRDTEVDVAFIEAGMSKMDGVELAWVLKRFLVAPAVVFVTRHPGRAADAFDLGAVDYLIKPAQPERLAESLRRGEATRRAARAGHPG